MHIALYHEAIIPPKKYGGTERIVYWLGKALIQLGHQVTLIAKPGSELEGASIITTPGATQRGEGGDWERLVPSNADIVHLWGTPHQPPKKPFIVTIQGNGKPRESFHSNTVFISRTHAENHGSNQFVYNGIDPEEYPCDLQRKNHLVFLAKASWKVKNLAGALEISRTVGLPLEVLGSRELPLRLQRFLPRWDGVKYHGMVDDVEKKRVLRNARALLFPVRWPEPFGIALTEALASGCAVFGTPYGSLPEIVEAQCGVLATSSAELVRAIQTFKYNPEGCRKRVYQGMTSLDMARGYLKHYERILNHPTETALAPKCRFNESSETLLPWTTL
jgi:glycosyltransferase involved in cell wall biosynthesis